MVEGVADVAVLAAAAPDPGMPTWLIYVGGAVGTLIVTPIVTVLVRALARRLGVPDDTTGGTHRAGEDRGTPATGPQPVQDQPAERYDAKMALIKKMVEDQDQRINRLEQELRVVRSERDRLWQMLQAPMPGVTPPWTTDPRLGPSPGS